MLIVRKTLFLYRQNMKFSKILFPLFWLFFSIQSFAADLVGISNLFKDTFWTEHYEERYCGKNIEKLVRKSIERRLDLTNAQIIEITDISGWMFGMVNALQAREGGRPITPAQMAPW
jgi:hypothetical protein